VDWVLDRLAQELDLLRGQLSSVHAAAAAEEPEDESEAESSDRD